MRLRVPVLLVGLTAVVVGVLVSAGPAAAAPGAYDGLVVTANAFADLTPTSAEGTRAFLGAQLAVSEATPTRYAAQGTDAAGRTASVAFSAPTHGRFTVGQFFHLGATATASLGAARVTWAGGTACTPTDGVFSVEEVSTDAGGTLTALSATYDLVCQGAGQAFTGLVRFHSSRGWQALVSAPEITDLGAVELGRSVTTTVNVVVVGQGSDFVAHPSSGTPSTGYEEVGNTCNRAQSVGDSCAVTVRFTPRTVGPKPFRFTFQGAVGLDTATFGIVATAVDTPVGTYYPTGPTRVLDTRTATGGHRAALRPGESVVVRPVTGTSHASAYVLGLTAVNPSASGYLTAYPTGQPVPRTSSLNVPAGRVVANLVTVPAGADGSVTIRNGAGTTHVVVDLEGWYSADDGPLAAGQVRGGGYHRTAVQRLLDTRSQGGALPTRQYVTVSARYPDRHVAALAVNVTVTGSAGSGYVTAWNASTDTPPLASTLNFARGQTVSTSAIVPASSCTAALGCSDSATIGILNGSGGAVHVIVDITGYFDDGGVAADLRFRPLTTPTRVLDTRTSLGTTPFGPDDTHSVTPSVSGPDTVALDTNLTAVTPTGSTYLTVWPDIRTSARPLASSVNVATGQVVANHAIAALGDAGGVNVYNFAGRVDVVADVAGTFDVFPLGPPEGIGNVRDEPVPSDDSPLAPARRPAR